MNDTEEKLDIIRNMFYSYFPKDRRTVTHKTTQMDLCKMYVEAQNIGVNTYAMCCSYNVSGQIVCNRLEDDYNMKILNIMIAICLTAVYISTPFLIRKGIRRRISMLKTVIKDPPHSLNSIRLVRSSSSQINSPANMVKREDLKGMKRLEKFIDSNKRNLPENRRSYKIVAVDLKIERHRLLQQAEKPIGLLKTFYSFLFPDTDAVGVTDTDDRSNNADVEACLKTNICMPVCGEQNCRSLTWECILRFMLMLLSISIVFSPMIFSLFLLYNYDIVLMNESYRAAHEAGLHYDEEFDFSVLLWIWVGLDAGAFLQACFGCWSWKKIIETFEARREIRILFRLIRIPVSRTIIKCVTWPFRKCCWRFLAICWLPFCVPLAAVAFSFLGLHSLVSNGWQFLNLTSNVVIICYFQISCTKKYCKRPFVNALAILLGIVIGTVILQTFWMIVEFGRIAMFIFICIVINYKKLTAIITLTAFIVVNLTSKVLEIDQTYFDFHSKIHRGLSTIVQENGTYLNHRRQRHQNEDEHANEDDRVEPLYVNEQTDTKINLTLKDGKIVLTPPSMMMFRDNRNQLYGTTKFFHKTTYIKELGSPGPVRIEVFKGFLYILLVFGFLAFVALIIIDLGDDYDLSTAVQFLLLLAGGLIPYVIRYFSTPAEKSDESKEEFYRLLEDASENHTESWFVSDITLSSSIESSCMTEEDIVVVVDENEEEESIHPSTSVQVYIPLD